MAKPAKLPPQNIEAEQSLLGALLIDKEAILKVSEILKPEDFYKTEQHGHIYEAIIDLFEARDEVDLITITDKLKKKGVLDNVGGSAYLTTLINSVPTSAHVEHYARIIKEHSVRRSLIKDATILIEKAFDEQKPVAELLEDAEGSIFAISQDHVKRDFIPIKEALAESFERLDELQKSSGKLRGVPTGFRDLDARLAGFQDSNLIILAARPGQGKCLAYDSKITNPLTGEVKTIEEYYQQKIKDIFTLDENLKITKTKITNFVDDGKKQVFAVRTGLGREIEVTAAHPFLTINGWKKLEELKVGDKIATPREIPVFGNQELEDYKIKALAYLISDGGLTRSNPRFTNTNPKIVADFTEAVLQFDNTRVSYDDSNGQRSPSYAVAKSQIAKDDITNTFSQRLQSVIKQKAITAAYLASRVNTSASSVSMWVNGQIIPTEEKIIALGTYFNKPREFFLPATFHGFQGKNSLTLYLLEQGLMGKNALEKKIPKIVFMLSKQKIALFLSRLFACDGSVYFSSKGVCISYASSSKALIYDVQHLLLRFGILSKVRTKRIKYKSTIRRSFEIEIRDCVDVLKFCQEIGIFAKEEKMKQAFELAGKRILENNFSRDTLPIEVWNHIIAAKGKLSWAQVYKQAGLPVTHNIHAFKRCPRRSTLLKIAQAIDSVYLEYLATSSILWDKIVSIENMGLKQVYDLTIEETHNFVANDFFVHNTGFALNIAQHVAVKIGLPVGFFSLEMSKEEIVDRLLVSQADIDAWKLKTGRFSENDKDWEKLSLAMGQLAEAPIYIDDTPGLSISEMRTKARRLQMEHGLKFIMVDYLQLMHGRTTDNRVQEVSEISQSLKNLARELKVPVLALSQLSRAVESRGTRKPQLADLRESGAIEQDADVVMFLYREDGENQENVTLDIQKHRNGPVGEIKLFFKGERIKFYGMEKARQFSAIAKTPDIKTALEA